MLIPPIPVAFDARHIFHDFIKEMDEVILCSINDIDFTKLAMTSSGFSVLFFFVCLFSFFVLSGVLRFLLGLFGWIGYWLKSYLGRRGWQSFGGRTQINDKVFHFFGDRFS